MSKSCGNFEKEEEECKIRPGHKFDNESRTDTPPCSSHRGSSVPAELENREKDQSEHLEAEVRPEEETKPQEEVPAVNEQETPNKKHKLAKKHESEERLMKRQKMDNKIHENTNNSYGSDEEVNTNKKGGSENSGSSKILLSESSKKDKVQAARSGQNEYPDVIEVCAEQAEFEASDKERIYHERMLEVLKIQLEASGQHKKVVAELQKSLEEKKKETDVAIAYLEEIRERETRLAAALQSVIEAAQNLTRK